MVSLFFIYKTLDKTGKKMAFMGLGDKTHNKAINEPIIVITPPGPVTPVKMPGASSYSQYDMMVGDGLSDNWHRTPGNKMVAKPSSTSSWPPG